MPDLELFFHCADLLGVLICSQPRTDCPTSLPDPPSFDAIPEYRKPARPIDMPYEVSLQSCSCFDC